MKLVALHPIVLCLLAFSAPAQHHEPPPTFDWEPDLATAVERSKESGKPIIGFFTFDTCHWCKVLEEKTFPDEDVRELGRSFHWVFVNRDVDPEPPERFNVHSYPGLLVLGHGGENIHRFHGFKEPDEFLAEMREGLRRWELYRAGEDWWVDDSPDPKLCESLEVVSIEAPTQEVPAGMCVGPRPDGTDSTLWVAQGDELFWHDGEAWLPHDKVELPRSTQDLWVGKGSDGGPILYAIASTWTASSPVLVYDLSSGQVIREIAPTAEAADARRSPRGLCRAGEDLYVLEISGDLHEVDESSGEIVRTTKTGLQWTFGLAFDGEHLICGSRRGAHFLAPESGEVLRTIPTTTYLRAVGYGALPGHQKEELLVMEQPIFGHGPKHERIVERPKVARIHAIPLAATPLDASGDTR